MMVAGKVRLKLGVCMLLMSGDGGGWECGGCDSEEVGNGSSW